MIKKAIPSAKKLIGRLRNGIFQDEVWSLDLAVVALEKQVPMLVTDIRNSDQDYFCPSCESLLMIKYEDYCWRCGQKLEYKKDDI